MKVVGIGNEIVECLRIARMVERHEELFLRKVFTRREIEYCSARARANQHYAGRWAAKEAVLKALGTPLRSGMSFRDIELRVHSNGNIAVALAGKARDICAARSIVDMMISISHCHTYASAVAIAVAHDEPINEIDD